MNKTNGKTGSTIVEFIFVFPTFLVICLFTFEMSLTWTDRHILKLATYDAARAVSQQSMPAPDSNGVFTNNPCETESAIKVAKRAAVKRMATVAPSALYFNKRLGPLAANIDEEDAMVALQILPSSLRRLALRWPTASALTWIECNWNSETDEVAVQVRYHRSPDTPIVGRVMWILHQLNNSNGPVKLRNTHLRQDFFGIYGNLNVLQTSQYHSDLINSLNAIQQTQLQVQDAVSMLEANPVAALLMSQVPDFEFDAFQSGFQTVENTINSLQSNTDLIQQQSKYLTAAAYSIPEALRLIPLTDTVTMRRSQARPDTTATSVPAGIKLSEHEWHGLIKGIGRMNSGNFDGWSKALSEQRGNHIKDGKPL